MYVGQPMPSMTLSMNDSLGQPCCFSPWLTLCIILFTRPYCLSRWVVLFHSNFHKLGGFSSTLCCYSVHTGDFKKFPVIPHSKCLSKCPGFAAIWKTLHANILSSFFLRCMSMPLEVRRFLLLLIRISSCLSSFNTHFPTPCRVS